MRGALELLSADYSTLGSLEFDTVEDDKHWVLKHLGIELEASSLKSSANDA